MMKSEPKNLGDWWAMAQGWIISILFVACLTGIALVIAEGNREDSRPAYCFERHSDGNYIYHGDPVCQ